jgi:hypothetical protein
MALVGSFSKQVREVLDFDINYDPALGERPDSITLVTSEVDQVGAGHLIVDSTSVAGRVVKAVVSGGLDTQLYKITLLVTTSSGLVYEDEVNVSVEEV